MAGQISIQIRSLADAEVRLETRKKLVDVSKELAEAGEMDQREVWQAFLESCIAAAEFAMANAKHNLELAGVSWDDAMASRQIETADGVM